MKQRPCPAPGAISTDVLPLPLRLAWDSSPALVAVTLGSQHLLAYQNRASQAMFGSRPLGRPLQESFAEVTPDSVLPMTEVLRTGRLVEVPRRLVGPRDITGEAV